MNKSDCCNAEARLQELCKIAFKRQFTPQEQEEYSKLCRDYYRR